MPGKIYITCVQHGLVKTGIDFYIDKEKHHLKPQDAPYVFDVAAGNHKLKFKDPAGVAKKLGSGVIGGVTAVTAGGVSLAAGIVGGKLGAAAAGTASGTVAGKKIGNNISNRLFGQSGSIKDAYDLEMRDNEMIRLICTKDKYEGIIVEVI